MFIPFGYGLTLIIIILIILLGYIFTALGFKNEKRIYWIWYLIARPWSIAVRKMRGHRVTLVNPKKAHLFQAGMFEVSPHNSSSDAWTRTAFGPLIGLGKASMFKIPIWGKGIYSFGLRPIHRKSELDGLPLSEVEKKALQYQEMLEAISLMKETKFNLVWFPSGHRVKTEEVKLEDWKLGVFNASIEHEHPILPIGKVGGLRLGRKNTLYYISGDILYKVGSPINPKPFLEKSGGDKRKAALLMREHTVNIVRELNKEIRMHAKVYGMIIED